MSKIKKKKTVVVPIKDIKVDKKRQKKAKESFDDFLGSTAHLHFFKCQDEECLLEFMVLSWKEDWPSKHKPYCPECNQQKASNLRSVSTNKRIYEVVYSDKWEDIEKHMKRKIIHFEDEKMLANIYSTKLKRLNFDYKFYLHPPKTEQELISLVLAEKPDLIIMDIIMPVMDGFKATEILKNNSETKDIPIMGLCNMGQKEDIDKARQLGMSDYFVNSQIIPTKFVARVESFFENPQGYSPKFG